MKIYYSNISSIKLWEGFPSIGILVSYYGLKNIKKPNYCDSLFLDSGAFSAFNKNISIDLQLYISFIKRQKHLFQTYASLDDISSYQVSLDNYGEMMKYGLDPLPCFHIGEPEWVLDKYLTHTSYVALGGIAKQNEWNRRSWLDRIFNKYPDKGKVRFHGFGIQSRNILVQYPWESVDASSCHVMARFGGICTPWGDIKINKEVAPKDLKWVSDMNEEILRDWIFKMGSPFDYDIATQQTVEGTIMRTAINILYYEQLGEQTIAKFVKKVNLGFGLSA